MNKVNCGSRVLWWLLHEKYVTVRKCFFDTVYFSITRYSFTIGDYACSEIAVQTWDTNVSNHRKKTNWEGQVKILGGKSLTVAACNQWCGRRAESALPKVVKIPENLSKIRKNVAPNVCRKNTWSPIFGYHTNKRSSWSFWEKICRQKNFSGKFWEKSFAPPKLCLLLHLRLQPTQIFGGINDCNLFCLTTKKLLALLQCY